MKCELTYFKQQHIKQITTSEPVTHEAEPEEANAFTLWVDGYPIMCAGVTLQWPSMGIAWAYIDKDRAKGHARLCVQTALWILKQTFDDVKVTRIETYVLSTFDQGKHFVELLGFVPEAIITNFVDYDTYYMYSILRYQDGASSGSDEGGPNRPEYISDHQGHESSERGGQSTGGHSARAESSQPCPFTPQGEGALSCA